MNEEIRKLFPITQNYLYLNHAAVTPYSTLVESAIGKIAGDITQNGSVNWHQWIDTVNNTRLLVAKLINAKAENIAFMKNTSDAISTVANGINWGSGDNVISCDIEFPANIYPWMRLKQQGVELRLAKTINKKITPESLFQLVDSRTKVIALSWVQYSSGFRADLATIGKFCRENNILFCVDGIQALGALELDVERDFVDTFAADAHKFLMGPEGVGVMFLSDKALAVIEPTTVGWLSVKNWWNCFDEDFEYKLDYLPSAQRFECGTPNTLGIHGLKAALELMLKIGTKEIENYLLDLCDYTFKGLQELGFETLTPTSREEASAIVCCRHSKFTPEQFYKALLKEKIVCAPRCGWLRISPHFYNNQADIDKLLTTLGKLIS
ncbi:MAG: aminotransferase class V-fold PLP-dependent enzyme [Blastocatellia bacterium]